MGKLLDDLLHHSSIGKHALEHTEIDDHVELIIENDDPGIAEEYHQRVFEISQTLKPRDIVKGSDIGLALVKKIITSQGGNIRVDSSTGQGTRMIVNWHKHSPTPIAPPLPL